MVQLETASGKWKPYETNEFGNYEKLHNCPNSPYNQQNKGSFGQKPQTQQQQQQFYKRDPTTSADIPKTSQGGLPLDTKRLLQAVVELTKEFRDFRDEIKNNVQIDSARYENQMDIIYNRLSKETEDDMKSASEMMINHSKIADDKQNFMQRKRDRTIHDESKEKTLDESIPDNADEFAVSQSLKEDDDEGVLDDE